MLEIENLSVSFSTAYGYFKAVDGFSLSLKKGEVVAIVGESGSGKSVAMHALMGITPWNANVSANKMNFKDDAVLSLDKNSRRQMLGSEISMIFQEPTSSLNPSFTVGYQIFEMLKEHLNLSKKERMETAIDLLAQVGIPSPKSRLGAYPHQLSGGMNQRIMIAMAISCNPSLLIADEPTTALDVTTQAQILDLLLKLQEDKKMSLILITHDMGVVAETAKRVVVQYAGQKIEEQGVMGLFNSPRHPYTKALLSALPKASNNKKHALVTIPGVVPGQFDRPQGCLFSPRCAYSDDVCRMKSPTYSVAKDAGVLCHYPLSSKKTASKNEAKS